MTTLTLIHSHISGLTREALVSLDSFVTLVPSNMLSFFIVILGTPLTPL